MTPINFDRITEVSGIQRIYLDKPINKRPKAVTDIMDATDGLYQMSIWIRENLDKTLRDKTLMQPIAGEPDHA